MRGPDYSRVGLSTRGPPVRGADYSRVGLSTRGPPVRGADYSRVGLSTRGPPVRGPDYSRVGLSTRGPPVRGGRRSATTRGRCAAACAGVHACGPARRWKLACTAHVGAKSMLRSPGADVGGVSPVPAQMWEAARRTLLPQGTTARGRMARWRSSGSTRFRPTCCCAVCRSSRRNTFPATHANMLGDRRA